MNTRPSAWFKADPIPAPLPPPGRLTPRLRWRRRRHAIRPLRGQGRLRGHPDRTPCVSADRAPLRRRPGLTDDAGLAGIRGPADVDLASYHRGPDLGASL